MAKFEIKVSLRNEFSFSFRPIRYINLYREENLTQEYLKVNPSGTVPALVDGDVTVWDSHAIGIYLVQKFAKDDKLYPKDFLRRTIINERLFFEASYLFARLFEICVSLKFVDRDGKSHTMLKISGSNL